MKKKHTKGIEARKSRYGFMFVLPWLIGFVLFFFIPIIQSLVYSLSTVQVTGNGIATEFVGLEHYSYLIDRDPEYLKMLRTSVISFAYKLPLILVVSIVLSLVLNQKFKGRVFFRGLFFLPVIIATGVVMELVFKTIDSSSTALGVSDSITSNMFSIESIMESLDLPTQIATYIQTAVSSIFDLIWECGIQIILFIAGLQSIPASIYEASKVEGATKWEEFWFITFPQLGRITLLVAIFTMLEIFADNQNELMSSSYIKMSGGIYDESSAMLWMYFAVVAVIMGILVALYSKFLLKKWE